MAASTTSASAANKENRAPSAATTAKSTSKPARKATGKGRSKAAQEPSRPAANEMGRDQDDDDDDELGMRSDDAEERDGADGEAEGDETTVVAETQFGAGSEPTATGKKGKAAAAAAGKRRPAAGATQGKKQALVEEFGDDLAAAGLAAPKSSAREKKLEAQLALAQRALSDYKDKFAKLTELRTTKAEAAELRLREIADQRQAAAEKTIAAYKAAADAITSEHAALQETAFASPRSKAARIESMRVREVEQHNAELLARVEELERVRAEEQAASETAERELVQRHAQEMARKIKEATSTAERELVELRQEIKMTRAELSAEVEQSKNLQQKLKSTPASSATVPAATAATHGVTDSLKLEIEQLTAKLNLNEDLTGFAVHSVRQEEMGAAYTCMLSDCAGVTGSLNFKLVFHPDATVSYTPDVDPTRDALLVELLPTSLQAYMRFAADHSSEFFKRLFTSINKVKL
ncbi:hypothetical protein JCM8202_001577 [Rhodotorula sphaerocarpa]